MKKLPAILYMLGIALVFFLPGCGGGNTKITPSAATGTSRGLMKLTIQWPKLTRLVPAAAQSINISLVASGQNITQKLIARPADGTNTTTVQFDNLPAIAITLTASAYPNADGTGTIQASGSTVVVVPSNDAVNASLTMDSSIAQVAVTPATPAVVLGQSTQLIVTAKDAQGNVVLVAPSQWKWSVDNAGIASITPNGERALLNGLAPGSVNVSVMDMESAKSVQTAATVILRGSGGSIAGQVTDSSGSLLPGIRVESSDGVTIARTTTDSRGQYKLDSVPPGQRVVTFAGTGQTTSYQITVAQGGQITLNAVLQSFSGTITGPPVITLNVLQVDQNSGQATVSGTIDQLDSSNAIVIVNGEETLFPVSGAQFSTVAILRAGLNTISVRASNALGTTLSNVQQVTYTPGDNDFYFKATLNWDGTGDIDLHTWDPANNHSSYLGKAIATGELDTDNVTSDGPENFTCRVQTPGRYKIAVNSYNRAEGRRATIKITINRGPNAGKTYNYGPYTFNGSDQNSDYPVTGNTIYWWRPVDVVIAADGSIAVDAPDTSVGLDSGTGRASRLKKKQ